MLRGFVPALIACTGGAANRVGCRSPILVGVHLFSEDFDCAVVGPPASGWAAWPRPARRARQTPPTPGNAGLPAGGRDHPPAARTGARFALHLGLCRGTVWLPLSKLSAAIAAVTARRRVMGLLGGRLGPVSPAQGQACGAAPRVPATGRGHRHPVRPASRRRRQLGRGRLQGLAKSRLRQARRPRGAAGRRRGSGSGQPPRSQAARPPSLQRCRQVQTRPAGTARARPSQDGGASRHNPGGPRHWWKRLLPGFRQAPTLQAIPLPRGQPPPCRTTTPPP
jgi:hypothetical protein